MIIDEKNKIIVPENESERKKLKSAFDNGVKKKLNGRDIFITRFDTDIEKDYFEYEFVEGIDVKMNELIELKINNEINRENLIVALNNAGYGTRVVERKRNGLGSDFFVKVYDGNSE